MRVESLLQQLDFLFALRMVPKLAVDLEASSPAELLAAVVFVAEQMRVLEVAIEGSVTSVTAHEVKSADSLLGVGSWLYLNK